MMNYVWDYGALDEEDEVVYIKRMLGKEEEIFLELIVTSQRFMRKHEENNYCVSLRDVNRCKHLKKYFIEDFFTKNKQPMALPLYPKSVFRTNMNIPHYPKNHFLNGSDIRSMVLALCHCYHSRLTETTDREKYRKRIAVALNMKQTKFCVNSDHIQQMIELEQMNLLDRMQLPSGTAKNEALRENVFVILVSILNKIPVFVVGKPGCSKSLSMQLIRSTLRGPDSQDKYFKTLPSVYVVSFQGSDSSTSEGIIKVFEKAKNYKDHNPNVMPVVLLDEIGLAENSSFNPLRALHNQLEPKMGGFPHVAVVGISNWALDSAKMNRAIHLSRPEPTQEDLETTAISIRNDSSSKQGQACMPVISDDFIKKLAKAYVKYQNQQKDIHMHGLRDFYSLIKFVARKHRNTKIDEIVRNGLLRNFGGLRRCMKEILQVFPVSPPRQINILKLIEDNFTDPCARHLMLITRGDTALDILEQEHYLEQKEHKILYGSRFKNDKREEYNYQILSEIILCMERGLILVMKDLECIYGSLYDMLNQSYTIVGKKKNCRVALGAYSNPMCQVHDSFRCVVMVEEHKLDFSDPPFLNRFEKQHLTFESVMSYTETEAKKNLHDWTKEWLNNEESDHLEDVFLGFHEDTLSSLVYLQSSHGTTETVKDIVKKCKEHLLKVACPDAVLKLANSKLYLSNYPEVKDIQKTYFKYPIHRGFNHFLKAHTKDLKRTKAIIYTHSSIHFDFRECLRDDLIQTEKLSNLKSQQDLSSSIQQFWTSGATVMILQCMPALEADAANMLLAKCQMDQYFTENREVNDKHVFLVVHLDRSQTGNYAYPWHFNFLCGWKQFTIDSLQNTSPVLDDFVGKSMSEVLDSETVMWQRIIDANMFLWCFGSIQYTENSRLVDSSLQLVDGLLHSDGTVEAFKAQIVKYLLIKEKKSSSQSGLIRSSWQIDVACGTDLMTTYSTLVEALIGYVKLSVRVPLAKIVIFLEKSNAWNGSFNHSLIEEDDLKNRKAVNADELEFWNVCFKDDEIFNISDDGIAEPQGSETCPISRSVLNLRYPFFTIFNQMIESHLEWLLKGTNILQSSRDHSKQLNQQLSDLMRKHSTLNHNSFLENHKEKFVYDLLNTFSGSYAPHLPDDLRVEVMGMLIHQFKPAMDAPDHPHEKVAEVYVCIWLNKKLLSVELQLIAIYGKTKEGIPTLLKSIQQLIDASESEKDSSVVTTEKESEIHKPEDGALNLYSTSTTGNVAEKCVLTKEKLNAILVTDICKALLPIQEVIDHFGGLNGWQQTANLAILLAGKVLSLETTILMGDMSMETSIFHFLRLCRDFANIVVSQELPNAVKLVSSLAAKAHDTKCIDVLDNKAIFDYLIEQLTESLIPETRLQTFKSLYFNLCIEANIETPILHCILQSVSPKSDTLPVGFNTVLHRILLNDIKDDEPESGSLPLCEEVICSGRIDGIFTNIVAIDKELHRFDIESHFSVACCDIIEDVAFKTLTWEQIKGASKECQLLDTAIKATEIVFKKSDAKDKHDQDRKSSLQYVCACSYLRAFIKVTAQFLHCNEDPRLLELGGEYYSFGNTLCHILSKAEDGDDELKFSNSTLYLLKCLRDHKSLFELRKWIHELPGTMGVLKKIAFQEQLCTSRLGYNPISYVSHYKSTMTAISNWLNHNDRREIDVLIYKAKSSSIHCVALVAAVSEMLYFVRTSSEISDTDRMEMEWFDNKMKETTSGSFVVLQRLMGTDRSCKFLDISEETNVRTLHQIAFVLHVTCTDFVCNKMTAAFLLQENTHDVWYRSNSQSAVEKIEIRRLDCVCGFSMIYNRSQDNPLACPVCLRENPEKKVISDLMENMSKSEFSEMNQIVNTILDMIRTSLMISRSLLVNTPKHEIQSGKAGVDKLGDATSPETETMNSQLLIPGTSSRIPTTLTVANGSDEKDAKSDDIKILHNQLNDNWKILEEALSIDDEGISLLLHTIMQRVLTAGEAIPVDIPFDDFLAYIIREILMNSRKFTKIYQTECFKAQGIQETFFEYQMEELPCHPQHLRTKCKIFRRRRSPTFENFQETFLSHTSADNLDYPFLRLFFRYHKSLLYVKHLPIFLKWNSVIKQQLGQTIKVRQARELKVSSILESSISTADGSALESANSIFDEFCKAWNDTYNAWEILTGSCAKFGIMSKDALVSACVMDTIDINCPLFNIIRVLQQVQNEFLQNAVLISCATYCPSLHFVVREGNVGVIQRVSLDKARDEIIRYEWSDKLLQNSDVGREYGEGCNIVYNFTAIESVLARSLVLNKAILTDGTVFTQFTFSDELIHASSSVLADISQQIPQECLSADVIASIKKNIQTHRKFASELLENLEIMLVLVKKTGGYPTNALEEYIKRWSTQLPGSFPNKLLPETRDSIQLRHVVDLYNILEIHLADEYMNSVEQQLTKRIPPKVSNDIRLRLRNFDPDVLKSSAGLIRLFTYRYLRPFNKVHRDTLNTSLKEVMERSAAETMDLSFLSKFITSDVHVQHVSKMHELIETHIQVPTIDKACV